MWKIRKNTTRLPNRNSRERTRVSSTPPSVAVGKSRYYSLSQAEIVSDDLRYRHLSRFANSTSA